MNSLLILPFWSNEKKFQPLHTQTHETKSFPNQLLTLPHRKVSPPIRNKNRQKKRQTSNWRNPNEKSNKTHSAPLATALTNRHRPAAAAAAGAGAPTPRSLAPASYFRRGEREVGRPGRRPRHLWPRVSRAAAFSLFAAKFHRDRRVFLEDRLRGARSRLITCRLICCLGEWWFRSKCVTNE